MATLLRSTPWVEPALEKADWLLPMPLSHNRMKERGFNQALVLARALCSEKVNPFALERVRHTAPLSSMNKAQRERQIRAAYRTRLHVSSTLQGKKIVLLDDVMTTGASLQAAALILRQAGVTDITALVFARTPE